MQDEKLRRVRAAIKTTDPRLPPLTYWWMVSLKSGLSIFEVSACLQPQTETNVITKH